MADKKLSPAQFIAWSKLISAMHQSLNQNRGLKVKVPEEQVALLKRAFYQIKASEPDLANLSLLSTAEPSIFLIYHPAEEIPNG